MCIRNKIVSLVYKLALWVVSGFALLSSLGLFGGGFSFDKLKYFPVALNAFCFLFYLASIIALLVNISLSSSKGSYTYAVALKGDVMVSMLFASLLYAFLLAGSSFASAVYQPRLLGIAVHILLPLLVWLDWLLFDRKGRYHAADPFYWLALPLLYLTFYSVYQYLLSPTANLGLTAQGGPFPYPFLDFYALGWRQSAIRVGLFLLLFLALGYIVFALDKLLGHFAKKALVSVPGATAADPGAPLQAGTDIDIAALQPPAPPPAMAQLENLQPPPPPDPPTSIPS